MVLDVQLYVKCFSEIVLSESGKDTVILHIIGRYPVEVELSWVSSS